MASAVASQPSYLPSFHLYRIQREKLKGTLLFTGKGKLFVGNSEPHGKKLDEERVRKEKQTYSGHNEGRKGMMRKITEQGRPSAVAKNHV